MKPNILNALFSFMTIVFAAAAQDCISRADFDDLVAQCKSKVDHKLYILVYTVEYNEELKITAEDSRALNDGIIIYNCYQKVENENELSGVLRTINKQPTFFKQVDLVISIDELKKVSILRFAKLTTKAFFYNILYKKKEFKEIISFQSKFIV